MSKNFYFISFFGGGDILSFPRLDSKRTWLVPWRGDRGLAAEEQGFYPRGRKIYPWPNWDLRRQGSLKTGLLEETTTLLKALFCEAECESYAVFLIRKIGKKLKTMITRAFFGLIWLPSSIQYLCNQPRYCWCCKTRSGLPFLTMCYDFKLHPISLFTQESASWNCKDLRSKVLASVYSSDMWWSSGCQS